MKFSCHKNSFLEQISYAKDISTSRDFNYSLINVLLYLEEDKLYILSTNGKIIYKSILPVNEELKGSCTVNSKKIYEIIKYFPESIIQFHLKDNSLIIYSLDLKIKRKYTLYTSSNEGYPLKESNIKEKFKSNICLNIEYEKLRRLIKKTIYVMFIDEARPFLNGACFEKVDSEFNVIATDGKRLALVKLDNDIKVESNFNIIIPYKTLYEISKMIKYGEENETCQIYINDNQVLFKMSNIELKSTLISGKYPNYKEVIPKNVKFKIQINREILFQSICALSLMSDQKLLKIIFEFQKNHLLLYSSSEDFGFSSDSIEYVKEVDQIELKIAFNCMSIIDLLKEIESNDVEIWLTDPKSPVLFKGVEDKDFYSIVAPMKMDI